MSPEQPDCNSRIDMVDETCRQKFELAWLSGTRKQIYECLPDPASDHYIPTLEELNCIQMELQWRAIDRSRTLTAAFEIAVSATMKPTLTEEYVDRFPEMADPASKRRLIRQEYLIRQRMADHP